MSLIKCDIHVKIDADVCKMISISFLGASDMASEQVNRVLEVEKKAQQLEQDARDKANAILLQADEEARNAYYSTLSDARSEVDSLYQAQAQKEEQIREDAILHAKDDADALREKAKTNRETAITAALNIVTGRQ